MQKDIEEMAIRMFLREYDIPRERIVSVSISPMSEHVMLRFVRDEEEVSKAVSREEIEAG